MLLGVVGWSAVFSFSELVKRLKKKIATTTKGKKLEGRVLKMVSEQ